MGQMHPMSVVISAVAGIFVIFFCLATILVSWTEKQSESGVRKNRTKAKA